MNINRNEYMNQLLTIINDKDIVQQIENSIYEFTLDYARINNSADYLLEYIYNDKFLDLKNNLDKNSDIQNNYLYDVVVNKVIDLTKIAYMSSIELFPDNWEKLIKRRELIEDKKNNMATTDIYTCRRCKHNKCITYEMQTRSCDENVTIFVKCVNCAFTFKLN